MSSIELSATLARVARLQFASASALTQESSLRRLRGNFARLGVFLFMGMGFLARPGWVQAQSPNCTTTPTGTQYSSSDVISTPDDQGNASSPVAAGIYPSTITVPGTVTGTVTGVQIRLKGISAPGQPSGSTYAYSALKEGLRNPAL